MRRSWLYRLMVLVHRNDESGMRCCWLYDRRVPFICTVEDRPLHGRGGDNDTVRRILRWITRVLAALMFV